MNRLRKTHAQKWTVVQAVLLIAIIYLTAYVAGTAAYAQTAGGFSIRAVIPENQVDTKQTYFDLRMEPGSEQEVEVIINNSRDEELVAEIQLNAASTGRNGTIVYTSPDVRDDIMQVSATDVATIETQSVTVPANSSKAVTVNIKMPEEAFDGVILGGIAVKGNETGEDTQAVEGVSLKNTITYVTALKLTENDREVDADFELTAVKPGLINYRTAVIATLRNTAPRIVKDMEVRAHVFRKGSDTVLRELELGEAEMAPMSTGDFVIDWADEALRPGVYRLRMTADYEGRLWEWDEEFTIAGEANDLNNAAVGIKKNYTWIYVLLGLALLALVWIIAYRRGKHQKDAD